MFFRKAHSFWKTSRAPLSITLEQSYPTPSGPMLPRSFLNPLFRHCSKFLMIRMPDFHLQSWNLEMPSSASWQSLGAANVFRNLYLPNGFSLVFFIMHYLFQRYLKLPPPILQLLFLLWGVPPRVILVKILS